jgi:leucine dehydrogenase
MSVFDDRGFDDHEHVSFFSEPSSGLRAVIAIHRSGPLGSAGGGCRIAAYPDEPAAVRDALRLSRAMTWKLALIDVPSGGAKAVVIADPRRKSERLLRAIGRAVDRLGGRFVIAADSGTTPDDLAIIARETIWVDRQKDSAAATAEGVLAGMRAAVRRRLGRDGVAGLTVAVQGLGRVGQALCRSLHRTSARLYVCDLDPQRVDEMVRELGVTPVAASAIFDADADVLAPCALSSALDADAVKRLRCAVVAGSANEQLADPALADELARRGVLYAPDFVVNAGGAIAAAWGTAGEATLRARLDAIGALVERVCERAEREGCSTHTAAERCARERLAAVSAP